MSGLSDFGLSAPSPTNATGDDNPGLAELLGNAPVTETLKAQEMTAKINELAGQEDTSFLKELVSPRGLALLLGTVGAGAAGGGLAAAGFGLGGAKGIGQVVAAEKAQKAAAIEELQDERDKALDRAERAHQRVATAFNTNPDAFVDPQTGKPVLDARVLGWYATGADIPLYADSRRSLQQKDDRWKARQDLMTKGLENAKSPEQARQILRGLTKNMGWDAPEEVLTGLADAYADPEGQDFESAFAANLFKYGGPSALDAMIFASESNLPLYDAEVLRRVQWQDQAADTQTPSQVINQRFLDLVDEVNAWEMDARNTDTVLQIRQSSENPLEARRAIAERALEGRTGDIDMYFDKANVPRDMDLQTWLAAYSNVGSKLGLVETVREAKDLNELRAMSPEEFKQYKAGMATELVDRTAESNQQTLANQEAALRNGAATTVQTKLKEQGVRASIGSVYQIVDLVYAAALEDVKKDANGKINRADFDALFNQYLQQAIDQNAKKE